MLIKPYYEVIFFPFYNAINKGPIVSEHQCRTRSLQLPCNGENGDSPAVEPVKMMHSNREEEEGTAEATDAKRCVAKHLPDKGNTTMHKGKGVRKCKRKNKEQQKQTEKTEKGNKTIDKTK